MFCWIVALLAATESRALPTANRIVCLTPALAEVVSDFLVQDLDRIVGVTEGTNHPSALKQTTSVGPYHQIQLERVVALKPDIVFASKDGNSPLQIQRLIKMGQRVVVVDTARLEMMPTMVRTIGESLGIDEGARSWESHWLRQIESFRARANLRNRAAVPAPKVLVVVGVKPIFVAAGETFLNDAVSLVGAKSVFADLPKRYIQVSLEEVLRRAPDVVLDLSGQFNQTGRYRVIRLKGDDLMRPSRRLLDGIGSLEKALYETK